MGVLFSKCSQKSVTETEIFRLGLYKDHVLTSPNFLDNYARGLAGASCWEMGSVVSSSRASINTLQQPFCFVKYLSGNNQS